MKTKVLFLMVVALISTILLLPHWLSSPNSGNERMLLKISNITNPKDAKRIWTGKGSLSKDSIIFAAAAYSKYEKLMLTKIANITKPEEALAIWSDDNYNSVGNAAFKKWEELFRKNNNEKIEKKMNSIP